MTIAAAVVAAVIAFVAALSLAGLRRMPRFDRASPALPVDPPSVDVIVAARNEAKTVEPALRSLLSLSYPRLRVIVVDDRSTDDTGTIVDRLAAERPERLRVVHVRDLPAHWLGKNHALWTATRASDADFLLFTDADVHFSRDAVERALTIVRERRLDVLAAMPLVRVPTAALGVFVAGFSLLLNLYTRAWEVDRPGARGAIGVGAFTLVRRSAYEAAGGHEKIALRPDDDLRLGRLLKRHGARCGVALARETVSLTWYGSVGELVDGLMKNAFAGFDYRWERALGAVMALLLLWVAPVAGLAWGPIGFRAACGAMLTILMGWTAILARASGLKGRYALGLPAAALLLCYIVIKAAARTLRRNGIEWRGTHYDLAALRRGR